MFSIIFFNFKSNFVQMSPIWNLKNTILLHSNFQNIVKFECEVNKTIKSSGKSPKITNFKLVSQNFFVSKLTFKLLLMAYYVSRTFKKQFKYN